MKDKIRNLHDIGNAVRELRRKSKTRTVQIAEKSGRSRDVLNRLEKGQDISLSSLLSILGAMDYGLAIVRLGSPTLAEMHERSRMELESDDE